ncbi:MAG: alpha/beta hydrolase, partial [Chlamydiia bacterium]|nr:alpha/beta hydrolase [Chlamydiia bacterium]
NPAWSEKEKLNFGAAYDAAENYQFLNRMKGKEFDNLIRDVVDAMTTTTASQEIKDFIISCFNIDPEAAALLYHDNLCMDWRDVIPCIKASVLVMGGRASITPWQSQEWISKQIPDAQLKIFDEQQAGSHFMFVENPAMFNEVVAKFLKA